METSNAGMSLDQWEQGGQRYAHHGRSLFFRDHGAGDSALLLIHGFPTASWDWAALWPELIRRYPRVIALDMLGFGFSDKPQRHDYTLVEQAELHLALLDHLGVRSIDVLAHDYGVSVAQELLARELEGRCVELHSVALLNGGLFPEMHRARPIQKLLLSPLGPWVARLSGERSFGRSFSVVFGPRTRPTPAELQQFWRLVSRDGGARIFHRLIRYIPERRAQRARWVGALIKTGVPLRLINGPEDPVSGAHLAAHYRQVVPRPDVVSLPGIGHYPQVEAPQAVLDALVEFHRG